MKNFIKAIDWHKFLKYEFWFLVVISFFYFTSPNKFPHNFYVIPLTMILFGLMMIINSYPIHYRNTKIKENEINQLEKN
jgi:hypothetical protein